MLVTATAPAEDAVRRVRDSGREDLVMVLGTGCCDSTAPFLYDRNYYPGAGAVDVGEVAGVRVFVQGWLAKLYGETGSLVVDVDENAVADSFSLETEFGCRFTLRLPDRAARLGNSDGNPPPPGRVT
jgi:uncharacterized protein (DUF779 family)